jgi:hypothetical protein
MSSFSTLTHLGLSVFASCTSYILFDYPVIESMPFMLAAVIGWGIVVPTIMLVTNSIADINIEDKTFPIIQFVSADVVLLAIQIAIGYNYYYPIDDFVTMTIILNSFFVIHILETCFMQILKFDKNGDLHNNVIYTNNSFIGVGLCIYVIYNAIHNDMYINEFSLNCTYSTMFIISYTIWITLCKISMSQDTTIFMFTNISLIVPIIFHLTDYGDWFQMRAIGLLFYFIVIFGFFPRDGRLLPMYNKENCISSANEPIVIFQRNIIIRYILLIAGLITCICSFIY